MGEWRRDVRIVAVRISNELRYLRVMDATLRAAILVTAAATAAVALG